MRKTPLRLRTATPTDVPTLDELIPRSVRALSRDVYTEQQIESAITHVFGVDSQLIADKTYFVVEDSEGTIAGCGGWSARQTLYGGDKTKAGADPLLDPIKDAARVRAFFVSPDFARRGVGSLLIQACFDAAYGAGFGRMELMATLPGVPLYERWGFKESASVWVTLPDGVLVPFVQMTCSLATVPVKICAVADRFAVTGRGLIVVTDSLWNPNWSLHIGDTIEVRSSGGSRLQAQIVRWESWFHSSPEQSLQGWTRSWMLGGITKDDVKPGDELWTVPPAPGIPVEKDKHD